MLNKLFPSFYGQSDAGGTNLSSGGTAEHLQGNEKSVISGFSSIPSQVSQAEVDQVARQAGELEGNSMMMSKWSEYALAAQAQGLSALDVRINHAQASMKNEEQYRKKLSKHGKNVLSHRVDVSATKQNLDGFQAALNNASETIAL